MNTTEARQLCQDLRRHSVNSITLRAIVVEGEQERRAVVRDDGKVGWVFERSARVVFEGGKNGPHSVDVGVSSEERVLAHWAGYCAANGLEKPMVGERVRFPSGSSSTGMRTGKVASVGPKRAVVEFYYKKQIARAKKNGTPLSEVKPATATVRISDLEFNVNGAPERSDTLAAIERRNDARSKRAAAARARRGGLL
jgi:hypothetical protein